MVVVWHAVSAVDGDIELVTSFEKIETLDMEDDFPIAEELRGFSALDMSVGAEATNTVRIENPDTKDEVLQPLSCSNTQANVEGLSRLEYVRW